MQNAAGSTRSLTTAHILEVAFPALRETATSLSAEERQVHVISQGAEPRWIIIGDPHNALSMLRSWRPWNPGSRLRWRAVLVATSMKMLPRLPGVKNSVVHIDAAYWRRILAEFPENWNAVIHVGNPSHTRKAIVFFFVRNEPVKLVAKIPLVPGGACAILNEASILGQMKAFEYLPKVLFQDSSRGVSVQSWLDGKPVSRGFTKAHVDILSTLVNQGSTTRVSDHRKEIADDLDKVDLPFDRSVLTESLDLLSYDEPLQGFVEHRDFAPWNLKWLPGGKLGLLDWEWSVAHSLPWQDACRFFYLDDALFKGHGKVWETITSNRFLLEYRRRFEIPTASLPALTMHYLLRILCTDWQSGNNDLAQHSFRQIQLLLDNHKTIAGKR
jgi:hypothetical protein